MRAIIAAALLLGMGGCASLQTVEPQSAPYSREQRIWLDADPACSPEHTTTFADPDDCKGILMLQRSGARLVGVSVAAGNHTVAVALASARSLGIVAYEPANGCDSALVRAFVVAATEAPLTVMAFGPLTNIATVLRCAPYLATNIREIIFVGGRRPGQEFVVRPGYRTLRDLNVEVDPAAVDTVLRSGIRLTLVPFEAGRAVPLPMGDARYDDSLPPHVLARARDWARLTGLFWGTGGSVLPFDPVAVAHLLWPDTFTCESVVLTLESRAAVHLVAATSRQPLTRSARLCMPTDPARVAGLIAGLLMQR